MQRRHAAERRRVARYCCRFTPIMPRFMRDNRFRVHLRRHYIRGIAIDMSRHCISLDAARLDFHGDCRAAPSMLTDAAASGYERFARCSAVSSFKHRACPPAATACTEYHCSGISPSSAHHWSWYHRDCIGRQPHHCLFSLQALFTQNGRRYCRSRRYGRQVGGRCGGVVVVGWQGGWA